MWLTKVKSRENNYHYLAVYCSESNRREKNVYALYRIDEAIATLSNWYYNDQNIPYFLKEQGCTKEKIRQWLSSLQEKDITIQRNDYFKKIV